MNIYKTAVNNPITTILVFVAVALFGIFSLVKLPIDFMPRIDTPYIMVVTAYPGASAEDIEENVSKPLENSLNGVENLKHISSRSKENISVVSLQFEYGTDSDVATNDVRDKLDMAKNNLPDEVNTPILFKFSTDEMPIMLLSVKAEESWSGLYKIINEQVATPLARVGGVGTVSVQGIPERQIRYCANASYGVISGGVDWLKYALNNFEGCKAIVYYCGHGIPDEKTGDAYIIPVDGKGTNTTTCYSLNTLYTTLANTKASNITYFMDACFTGANKEGSMLVAARGVAREAKKEVLAGKAVVFSASSGDETAMTYPEKGHGLFTYFLLKKLQETQGNVSYSDLADYINKNVKKEAFLINEKPQTPVVATSTAASSTWKNMTLK